MYFAVNLAKLRSQLLRYALIPGLLFIAACSPPRLVPLPSEALQAEFQKASVNINFITSCIDLGSCENTQDLSKVEDKYVLAHSSLKSSRLIASNLNVASNTSGMAAESRDRLVGQIMLCEEAVQNLYNDHKSSTEQVAYAGTTILVDVACDIAANMVYALQ